MQNSNIKTEEEAESVEAASIEANPPTPINDEKISIEKETCCNCCRNRQHCKRKKKCVLKERKKLEADLLKSDMMRAKIKFIKKKLNK